jgi:hypothetical protein
MTQVVYKKSEWRKIQPEQIIEIIAGGSRIKGRVTDISFYQSTDRGSKITVNNGITVDFSNISAISGEPLAPANRGEAIRTAIKEGYRYYTGGNPRAELEDAILAHVVAAVDKWDTDHTVPVEEKSKKLDLESVILDLDHAVESLQHASEDLRGAR